MTLLDRILTRGFEMPGDPIIVARIERHVRRIQPDPLFRRRLRSVVVNRYVATREGMLAPAPRPVIRRQMGALGRGVLYASLLTAVGTTAVGAASQGSLPGDALYGVKLELEALRMQVAPPSLRDDLAAMALDERLEEVERLAAAGRWNLVDEAAARAAAAQRALAAFGPGDASGARSHAEAQLQRHAERLAQLLPAAPASASDDLQRAVDASTGSHEPNPRAGDDKPSILPPAEQPTTGPAVEEEPLATPVPPHRQTDSATGDDTDDTQAEDGDDEGESGPDTDGGGDRDQQSSRQGHQR